MVTPLNQQSKFHTKSGVTVVQSIKEGQSIALGAEPPNGGSLLPQSSSFSFTLHPGATSKAALLRKEKKPAGPFPLDR